MTDCLHITNGDSATALMQEAGLGGELLPWRDLLHQGPIPQGLELEALSTCRADYIAALGWGDASQLQQDFKQRDQRLQAAQDYQQVVLWFEHDLYDQLQLLQLLDFFQHHPHPNLSLICTDQYLGRQSPDQLLQLRRYRQPVSRRQLELGSQAWSALRHPDPRHWQALLQAGSSALPFLNQAVLRLLQEYPSCRNGLSRSAEQALQLAAEGIEPAAELFRQSQRLESRVFMGDASFWQLLAQLLSAGALQTLNGEALLNPIDNPPKSCGAQRLRITETGRQLLRGERQWEQLYPIDHWIGGVHLQGSNLWCWDAGSQSLRKAANQA
ncbi:DUF1835 domain-containing protein [Motiliproteus coralliicola]|uniref:DUF1835 domain-containing protein n=1 Tax=Motiliproteus coralliicola TaxID=2283196 RepID=A0A369WXC8_9GAMM|nr:DUF1835 domain-containing protein [Motiliproteus coralliicola]RDE25186.1 DUF1835 domain-containing protein [Motiliproteus coralliicola]